MSRSVSANFWRAVRLSGTDEDFHILLTITHAKLITPITVISDTVDLVSNGVTYIGFPFEFIVPQEDEQIPRGILRIQNVDDRIGQQVKLIRGALRLSMSCVLRSNPDLEEFAYKYLYLVNVRGNPSFVEADIASKNYTTYMYPNVRASKANLPGLYSP